jgi:integrase
VVFAREQADLFGYPDGLGLPLAPNILAERTYERLVKAAGVKRIVFHGLRHTSATLLLSSGVPVKVVSERLGHAKASMTLDIYTHVLPTMQRAAADSLGAQLHG